MLYSSESCWKCRETYLRPVLVSNPACGFLSVLTKTPQSTEIQLLVGWQTKGCVGETWWISPACSRSTFTPGKYFKDTEKEQALCDVQLINKKKRGGGGAEETPLINIHLLGCFYLDGLPFDLHRLLSEIHSDGGFGLIREAAPGETEGEAGLPHVGVPDDDDLKDPRLDAELQGGGAQVHGGRETLGGVVAAAGSAPTGSVEIHGGCQDGDIVVRSVSSCDSSSTTTTTSSARYSGLLLRGIVGHYAGGGDAQIGVRVWRGEGVDGWMDEWREGRGGGRKEGGGPEMQQYSGPLLQQQTVALKEKALKQTEGKQTLI